MRTYLYPAPYPELYPPEVLRAPKTPPPPSPRQANTRIFDGWNIDMPSWKTGKRPGPPADGYAITTLLLGTSRLLFFGKLLGKTSRGGGASWELNCTKIHEIRPKMAN